MWWAQSVPPDSCRVNVLFDKTVGGWGGSVGSELKQAELSLLRFVVEKAISCSAFEIQMNLDVTQVVGFQDQA